MLTKKRFLIAMLLGVALACGGKGGDNKKPPTGGDTTKPPAGGDTTKPPTGDDPLSKLPGGKEQIGGKEMELPKDLKDAFQLKATVDGKATVITFAHKEHATKRAQEAAEKCADLKDVVAKDPVCVTCHHKEIEKKDAAEYRKCEECHKAAADEATKAPSMQDAMHKRCTETCHKVINEKCPDAKLKTATNCNECHKAPSTDAGATESKDAK